MDLCEHDNETSSILKVGEFLVKMIDYQLLGKSLVLRLLGCFTILHKC
jgi:hypothetical protein